MNLSGHDMLFDEGIRFRPTTTRSKRAMTDGFWWAVKRELETGCTCLTFDDKFRPIVHLPACSCAQNTTPPPTVIFTVSDARPEARERIWTIRTPSRIRPLIVELLAVILTVILPSPVRVCTGGHYRTMFRKLCPGHVAQVQLIREGLDPDLIVQELTHGLFDPSGLFVAIGDALKCHCAPMRDAMVDAMVTMAQLCAPGKGGGIFEALRAIRMCFELVEIMKLVSYQA